MAKFIKLKDGEGKTIAINIDNILYYRSADAKTTSIYMAAMNKDFPVSIPVKGEFEVIDALLNKME